MFVSLHRCCDRPKRRKRNELLITVTEESAIAAAAKMGAQMVGHLQSELAKRIDIFATALYHHMLVEQVSDLDLSYTPPLSSPWDPVQMSAQVWEQTHRDQLAP